MGEKVFKSEAEWKRELTSEQFRVTRQKGTERAFTGEHWDNRRKGTYRCVCCGTPLFSSDTKFESGTGWPSFTSPVDAANVREARDNALWMRRTEVLYRMRRPPRPRVPRRTGAHGASVLLELGCARVRAEDLAPRGARAEKKPARAAGFFMWSVITTCKVIDK